MVKLTADMKEAFGKMKVFPFATATKDGTPDVIPLGISWLMADDTVLSLICSLVLMHNKSGTIYRYLNGN
jgi:predicted pyridoxine 5'-phosphate oxidase superfamily flavin-nucleotide-binding protein